MSILDAVRAPFRRVETGRANPSGRQAGVTRALLVNGQMQTIAQIREDYVAGTMSVVSGRLSTLTGDYAPEEVARAYKTGITTFVGINVRCGISAEIPVHVLDARDQAVEDSPAEAFRKDAPKHIWRLLAHYLIFGAIYIRKVRNRHGYPSGLEILSPLDVRPEVDYGTGTVRRYRLMRMGRIEYILPDDMIVELTFNPFSDVDGTSAVEVAKVRNDIETNIGRYGAAFFSNGALPAVVVTTEADLDPGEQKEAKLRWEATFKGVLNAFRTFFAGGGKWTVQKISSDPADLAMTELTDQADMKILAVMRVNPILAGYGNAADALSAQGTYESVRRQHIEFTAIPDVRQLCNVLNEQWLHKDFPGGCWTLEPDVAAITSSAMGTGDRITSAVAAVGRVWSVNEGREYTGKPVLKNIVQFNPDWALQLWQAGGIKRSQLQRAVGYAPDVTADGYVYELDPRAKGVPANTPSPFGSFQPPPAQSAPVLPAPSPAPAIEPPRRALKIIDVVPKRQAMADTCYVLLSLANDPQLEAIQAQLRGRYPDVEWSAPDSFHITLVYATSPVDIDMVKQVLPQSINPFSFQAGPAGTFDNTFDPPDSKPLVLWVDAPLPLIALQSGLAGAFRALGLELSEYSVPDNWRPHITLGYVPADQPMPEWNGHLALSSETLIASIEGNGQFETVYVTRSKELLLAQLNEVDQWRKRVKSKGHEARFATDVLPAELASWVRANLADEWNPTLVFEAAREALRTGRAPEPLGVSEEEANFYWRHFDELKVELGADWLAYQQAVSPAILSQIAVGQVPDAGTFAAHHAPLLNAWIGTTAEPGSLTKLIIAGMRAGQAMLERDKAIKPGNTRAIEIAVDWTLQSVDALNYVRSYAFDLIKGIDDTTRSDIGAIIERVIAEGLTDEVRNELLKDVLIADGTTPSQRVATRAGTIGDTESARAYNTGAFKRWEDVGVTQAEWMTVNQGEPHPVCPLCRRLAGQVADIRVGWTDPATGIVYKAIAHVKDRCFRKPRV